MRKTKVVQNIEKIYDYLRNQREIFSGRYRGFMQKNLDERRNCGLIL